MYREIHNGARTPKTAILTNNYQKIYSKQCLQTIVRWIIPNIKLTTYPQRNHFKQCLQIIIRETIPNNAYNFFTRNHSQQYLQTIIRSLILNNVYIQPFVREIIPNKAYKLLSQNSLQTMITNYCKMNHSKHKAYNLFPEKPF